MKYRKKPIVIEAVEWLGTMPSFDELAELVHENLPTDRRVQWGKDGLSITTLEGVMRAEVGDFIIRGVKGELYPCKLDIFKETYEKVDNSLSI